MDACSTSLISTSHLVKLSAAIAWSILTNVSCTSDRSFRSVSRSKSPNNVPSRPVSPIEKKWKKVQLLMFFSITIFTTRVQNMLHTMLKDILTNNTSFVLWIYYFCQYCRHVHKPRGPLAELIAASKPQQLFVISR